MLKKGSNVVVTAGFSRSLLASPLICKRSLADLVERARQVSDRTGNPVFFVKAGKKNDAYERITDLAWAAQDLELVPSPFYNQGVVKKLLEDCLDKDWQFEWSHSGNYHSVTKRFLPYAHQTKQWFPDVGILSEVVKFGRPTLGYFIQFLTGHGWFGRHRSKIEEVSDQCRFCNSALEDPRHLWSSCRNFEGVRFAIRKICDTTGDTVSFEEPFVWSVTLLVRFFRDPRMAQLLTGPGSQQLPL